MSKRYGLIIGSPEWVKVKEEEDAMEEPKINWNKLLIEKSVLLALSECNLIVTKNKLENIINKVIDSLK